MNPRPPSQLWKRLAQLVPSLERLSFVEVGANDGRIGDPIRNMVIRNRWTGTFFEPIPNRCKTLEEFYARHNTDKRLTFIPYAIADYNGTISLYEAGRRGIRSSIVPESLRKSTLSRSKKIEVQCMSLPTALKNINSLDVLQVDVEGYDFGVIQQIDKLPFKPSIIHFEHAQLMHLKAVCFQFLMDRGYVLENGDSVNDTLAWKRNLIQWR